MNTVNEGADLQFGGLEVRGQGVGRSGYYNISPISILISPISYLLALASKARYWVHVTLYFHSLFKLSILNSRNFIPSHSDRRDSTGFISAAFRLLEQIVAKAMSKVAPPASTKTHHSIST